MTSPLAKNQVRSLRIAAGLTQTELAERAGVSRTAVTAIEGSRLVPSVATALALAKVLGATVEDLFREGEAEQGQPVVEWAWPPHDHFSPSGAGTPRHRAEIAGRVVQYPASAQPMWSPWPEMGGEDAGASAGETLVIAGCDPAVGLLAQRYAAATGLRLLVVPRSSRAALEMLARGLVHLAGLHFSTSDDPDRNLQVAKELLPAKFQLLRMAQWEEGIAVAPSVKLKTVAAAGKAKLTWVGREAGSGARRCLDRLFDGRTTPRRQARNHRGVAEAIQSGWADAGVCVRLASAEAGLDFLPLEREAYDVCIPEALVHDRRVKAFIQVVKSASYRKIMSALPGYDMKETGSLFGSR
ncbi:MAG: XRE family transcriptional regulator [Planctomyces sp.]|nr:XRE family transcriptional regulator [Planctomyces sp.]